MPIPLFGWFDAKAKMPIKLQPRDASLLREVMVMKLVGI